MSASHRPADSPYVVPVRDIAGRPGAQRLLSLTFPAPAVVGTDVIGVPEGADLELELSLESVSEGIWVSGTASGQASGECGRCLDAVTEEVTAPVQGLFALPNPDGEDGDSEDVYAFDGEAIDLEDVVRDAVADALPFTPLCEPDCPGLCDQCGARLADDPDHKHDVIDPRWSALESLGGSGPTETKES